MKKLIAALLLVFAPLTGTLMAQSKIAVVDVNKAFTEYWKTKQASAKMAEEVTKARKEISEQYEQYQKLMESVQALQKQVQDPVLAPNVRQEKAKALQDKMNEGRSLERSIQDFRRRREMQIQKENNDIRRGIHSEIMAVIQKKASDGSFDLVFDKSGVGLTQLPVLVYQADKVPDFTNEVIADLNKDAPANLPATPAAAPAAPAAGASANP